MTPNIFRIWPESRELQPIDITLSNPLSYGIHVPIVPILLHDTSNYEKQRNSSDVFFITGHGVCS